MLPKFLLFSLLGLTHVSAAPSDGHLIRRQFKDYGVEILEWEIQAFPSGPTLVLNGTIEEVNDQLLKINPNFAVDFSSELGEGMDFVGDSPAEPSVEKRTDFSGSRYMCDTRDWVPCYTNRIKNGISHLRRTSGRPKNGPGPGNCGRVSCSGRSAIWWCNDERSTKELGAFSSIADGAQYLVDRCQIGRGLIAKMAGQVFHKTNWNVIVRYDDNNCGTFGPSE
ncbi:hypothetical protein CSUB01_08375 [Colletotrichum sublineola]|uniref:Ecp2 effector protein domain-containing protein n=1 Tax=Colletotrichum sublineola TaxID=1173701 RepID=A0A066X867_COLSU|nr:hypothetical protein CSUB01_08375 [Colletotrichum sublineola]